MALHCAHRGCATKVGQDTYVQLAAAHPRFQARAPWLSEYACCRGHRRGEHQGRGWPYAAEEGHEAVVKMLVVRDDVKVNTKDWRGYSPLSYTARNGREVVVKMLVARDDVEVNTKDRWSVGLFAAVLRRRGGA